MVALFPDSELELTRALRDELSAVHVGIAVPSRRRGKEVIVRRDGGPDGLVVSTQLFGIRVFAPTEKEAAELADETSARLRALRFTTIFRGISTTSPFPVEDVSGIPCRYFTAEVGIRGRRFTA